MRKIILKFLASLAIFAGLATVFAPSHVFAADNCDDGVSTNIIGENGCWKENNDKGDGVYHILLIILNILTFGVGVAGTLGVVLSGIQYLTAGDNTTKTAKAKNRLIQVIIGLVIYAVMWGVLQWLLPGGIFGDGS